MGETEKIQGELDAAITELKKIGVDPSSYLNPEVVGLGDVVEGVLSSMGITQERFKNWFNLAECNCTERKAWLNSLFSWHRTKKGI